MGDVPFAQRELLTVEEVARYLKVGPATIYRWCREGRMPCLKIGKYWRIRREELEELVARDDPPVKLTRDLQSFLAVLPAHIAIIDGSGTILAVNEAWRNFARSNGATEQSTAEGVNYLEVCDAAEGDRSEEAAAFAEGIRSVLSGRRREFAMEYPCHSPTEKRWFVGWVTSLPAGGGRQAVVAHENISERKELEEKLGASR